MIHQNDRQNLKKHAKMLRRAETGKVSLTCKWSKRRNKRA